MNCEKKISVIMGIYNCAGTLQQAVKSIQNQTYTNWELIMCDDGSTDDTFQIATRLQKEDSRIILLKNKKNVGLNKTLNHCLSRATGEYIARMDGDDECMPDRFEKEIQMLQEEEQFDIVSSAMIFFDDRGEWGRNHPPKFPAKSDLIIGSPICHAPVMMRKRCMDDVGGYTEDPKMLRVEDVNLWIKLYQKGYRCINLEEPLYKMRNDQSAANRRKYQYRINETYVRLLGCFQLRMAPQYFIYALKPLIAGVIPARLRFSIKKKHWKKDK